MAKKNSIDGKTIALIGGAGLLTFFLFSGKGGESPVEQLGGAVGSVGGAFGDAGTGFGDLFTGLGSAFAGAGAGVQGVGTGVGSAGLGVGTGLGNVLSGGGDLFSGGGDFLTGGGNLFEGFGSGINSIFGNGGTSNSNGEKPSIFATAREGNIFGGLVSLKDFIIPLPSLAAKQFAGIKDSGSPSQQGVNPSSKMDLSEFTSSTKITNTFAAGSSKGSSGSSHINTNQVQVKMDAIGLPQSTQSKPLSNFLPKPFSFGGRTF